MDLKPEQRTEITRTITRTEVKRVDADINVSVGVAIPSTVELHVLPANVVTIVPQFRGYRYFVLADGRIVIVDPDTFMVVTILEA